ncbi:MAG: fibronectin type III domain-containing protein [Chloroflexi bacterium]|nr:fibronectin type III domain-containing protein [Chloroflexota bacterium]
MPVEILRPNANGDLVQLYVYPSDGIHWNKLSELVADYDASYIHRYGGTTGTNYDSYQLADLSLSNIVITNVRVVAIVRREAMNPGGTYPTTVGLGVRINGLNYYSNDSFSSNSYITIVRDFPANPNTGGAWTVAAVNAMQAFLGIGFYNMAYWQGGLISARCTQLYVEVTYAAPPSVSTLPATNVAITSATLNGLLDSDGGLLSDCRFEWGPDTNYGFVTPTVQRSTGQSFAQAITGLQPGATYHFRAVASNANGTSYGSDQSFATPAVLPAVDTEQASDIGLSEATLQGSLTDDGGQDSDCRFEWGLTPNYGNETPWQSGRRSVVGFVQPIASLKADTFYHFRALARNSAGVAAGANMTFRTLKEVVEAPSAVLDPSLKMLLEEEA